MSACTLRQYVELFHLLFVSQLVRKLDKRFYALKGGCNMRFFFKSPRYSEDIDLDVHGISVDVLRTKVNSILNSKPFTDILQVRDIEIEHITEHEQTEATQRGITTNISISEDIVVRTDKLRLEELIDNLIGIKD